MKVIILAAGQGNRLGDHDLPKPLTPLSTGKSILGRQLDLLRKHVSLNDVMLVVGHHKEAIMDAFPELLFVYNPAYAHENTAKSLLRALVKCNEDVLWLNGDVVFHHSVLAAILALPQTGMIVNQGPVGEEEVKYRQDVNGLIETVSKQVTDPQGEALGINYCSVGDLPRFRCALEVCENNDYFERGLDICIEQGMKVKAVCVERHLCTEVDFPADLERANMFLKEWLLFPGRGISKVL